MGRRFAEENSKAKVIEGVRIRGSGGRIAPVEFERLILLDAAGVVKCEEERVS
jgi:hypothetical protein